MTTQRWLPGTVICKTMGSSTYYGRLLKFPWAAFYDLRTAQLTNDLQFVVSHPVLFMVAAHKDLLGQGEWEAIGRVSLDGSLRPPRELKVVDILDPSHHRILDEEGNIREATEQETAGLEEAAVWEPENIRNRLISTFADRTE